MGERKSRFAVDFCFLFFKVLLMKYSHLFQLAALGSNQVDPQDVGTSLKY